MFLIPHVCYKNSMEGPGLRIDPVCIKYNVTKALAETFFMQGSFNPVCCQLESQVNFCPAAGRNKINGENPRDYGCAQGNHDNRREHFIEADTARPQGH